MIERNSQMQKHFSKLFCFNKHSRQVTFEKNWQIESLFPNSEMESDTKAVHLSNGTVNLGAHWHIICHTFILTFFLQAVQGIHPTLSCYQCEVSSGEPDASFSKVIIFLEMGEELLNNFVYDLLGCFQISYPSLYPLQLSGQFFVPTHFFLPSF